MQVRPHEGVNCPAAFLDAWIEAIMALSQISVIPLPWPVIADDAAFPEMMIRER
jgi:hypothetical protein